MDRLQVSDLPLLAPELTLVILAVILTAVDLMLPNDKDRRFLGWISVVGLSIALFFTVSRYGEPYQQLLSDSYRVDDFANLFKTIFLLGAILVTILMMSYIRKNEVSQDGEMFYLLVAATLGAMLMASSTDLITLFVGLELLSISSYILVGARKAHLKSNEAAFKYIVLGGIASAFVLYGMSFLYGLTGATNLMQIGQGLSTLMNQEHEVLVYLAFFLMLAGFGFKIAMAPFHMWAPDVYQGAPTPITAFLTSVSKAAGIAIVYRVFLIPFLVAGEIFIDIAFYIAVTAAIAMVVGNTVALRQANAKRLMAYSSIANAGYLLVPFVALSTQTFSQLIYYLLAYVLMNIGTLALIMALTKDETQEHDQENLSIFSGLYHRSPWTAAGMTVLVLSLAGIPVTAGFFGKFYILWSAIRSELFWLAGIMIVTSVISFFYYFGIIRQMYMRGGTEDGFKMPALIGMVFWFTIIATVGLGFFPNAVLELITSIFSPAEDLFGIVRQ
jgi:NADH-quinone oxidoreductase subunit N